MHPTNFLALPQSPRKLMLLLCQGKNGANPAVTVRGPLRAAGAARHAPLHTPQTTARLPPPEVTGEQQQLEAGASRG
ncbi:hypothetical protein NDU88_007917 [Pleurodeles waltl]|uniref:Uncharacterized protein n=1 Tax=Pleurodeles waltl TaxID=8319 RepID=A0AAV7PQN7_PLEWA|nr:hypothetical protein NDU88_007917 [Pleurodeles waltl]